MACASQSIISVSSCAFSRQRFMQKLKKTRKYNSLLFVRASSSTDEDCNSVECAPDKEVGKVSVEWLAEEKTKVVGTFPPRRKGWTGYVEKDTAGQTNIYSVEPAVYVAESAISSGNAGTSSEGSQNTVAVVASIALIAIAAASTILLQLGKDLPQVKTTQYSGPSLSYYINKFKPVAVIEAATPAESQNAPATVSSETSSPQAPQVEVESQSVPAVSSSDNSS